MLKRVIPQPPEPGHRQFLCGGVVYGWERGGENPRHRRMIRNGANVIVEPIPVGMTFTCLTWKVLGNMPDGMVKLEGWSAVTSVTCTTTLDSVRLLECGDRVFLDSSVSLTECIWTIKYVEYQGDGLEVKYTVISPSGAEHVVRDEEIL